MGWTCHRSPTRDRQYLLGTLSAGCLTIKVELVQPAYWHYHQHPVLATAQPWVHSHVCSCSFRECSAALLTMLGVCQAQSVCSVLSSVGARCDAAAVCACAPTYHAATSFGVQQVSVGQKLSVWPFHHMPVVPLGFGRIPGRGEQFERCLHQPSMRSSTTVQLTVRKCAGRSATGHL
jgi:hypothetical protein